MVSWSNICHVSKVFDTRDVTMNRKVGSVGKVSGISVLKTVLVLRQCVGRVDTIA